MTAEWRPATGSEQALLNAVTTGDEDGYLAELARGTLWVPVLPDDTSWMTADRDGRRYLMGYTSEAMFRAAFRGAAPPPHREVTLGQLAQTWPDPRWWLAVAPATPIEAHLSVAQLAHLAAPPAPATVAATRGPGQPGADHLNADQLTADQPGGDQPLVLPRPAAPPEFVARNELEDLLVAAVDQDDLDTVLKALLVAQVVAPVADDTPADAVAGSAEFRWRIYRDGDGPCVPLFTAASRCDESVGAVPTRLLEGLDAVTAWPDPGVALVLNPGTSIEVSLPGQAVIELAEWAAGIGMTTLRPEPVGAGMTTLRPEPAPPGPRSAAAPVVLQRPVPAEHVTHYLRRGYDLVSGWAYPLERATPRPGYALRWVWSGHGPYVAGDAGIRVTGAKLPHGAELRQLDASGDGPVIATYDADLAQWRPVEGGAA